MLENQIPNEWKEVLAKLQTVFSEAIIGGGALRDLDYDKSVKDVDIFIPITCCPDGLFDSYIMEMFAGTDIKALPAALYGQEHEINFSRIIYAVYEVNLHGKPFNIIITNNDGYDIGTFDFSICQIKFDGKEFTTTEAYEETKRTKVITLMTNKQSVERVSGRVERLRAKFPDFKFDTSLIDMFQFDVTKAIASLVVLRDAMINNKLIDVT